ncbi:MAG: prenyltransferase/squalene oxidase repeat-containing protein [Planctomycetaceae bacterium]
MCNIRRRSQSLILALVLTCVTLPATVEAAPSPEITRAIKKGADYLASRDDKPTGSWSDGRQALMALAILKSGESKDHPKVRSAVAAIRARTKSGGYQGGSGSHVVYVAGLEAMLLVEVDPAGLKADISAIAKFIVEQQFPHGGWNYPSRDRRTGDISVTQYAMLGLWSAERAGVDVPDTTWNKAAEWLLAVQESEGGYRYVPGTEEGDAQGRPTLNMTGAAVGSLLIAMMHLYPGEYQTMSSGRSGTLDEEPKKATNSEAGELTRIDLSRPTDASPEAASNLRPTVKAADLAAGADQGLSWVATRFRSTGGEGDIAYYFYTIERLGALSNRSQFGSSDWYAACSQELLKSQQPDGSWKLCEYDSAPDYAMGTSFIVLFLAKSTSKILNRTAPESHGGGLLTGGKGEPMEAVVAKKDPTPLDQLLKSLQDPGALDLEQAQSELIEQVQLGDRNELIGQKEMLVKLIQHPHGEIRRTAAWALGRTNDLHLARYLIDALEDQDLGVMMEAHAALSWLSRRFDGFGLPVNPLDDLKPDANDAEKASAIEGWRVRARRNWGNWYLRVRPYADRGDEFEAKLRQRLGEK